MIKPPHPGDTIREDYLIPLAMSVNQLAKALGITPARLNEIVRGERGVTADTALRLARCLGTSAQFWLNLQSLYDLRTAEQKARNKIAREVAPLKFASLSPSSLATRPTPRN
jgi:addiction module HigA family antidote